MFDAPIAAPIKSIVFHAYVRPIALQSDVARRECHAIAAAASMGFLTTEIESGDFGRKWRVTEAGLRECL